MKFIKRSPAVARTADRTGCQLPSRSSKVDNFHVIWKPICDFPSTINSNLGPLLHHSAFKVIQGQWFPFNLIGVRYFISVINSNLRCISQSHRFWDMSSFSSKMHIFPTPPQHSIPNLKMFPFEADGWNFACPSLKHTANYSCFPYALKLSHNTSVTDVQRDGRTDDNHDSSSTVT